MLKGLFFAARRILKIKCELAELEPKFTDDFLDKIKPDAEALKNFDESLKLCQEAYGWQPWKHTPILALATSTAEMAAPLVGAVVILNEEIKRRRKEEGAAK